MLTWPIIVLAGLLGAALASFVQCVITRTRAGKSWVNGRSVCDNCGRQLTWYENIPVVSYVLQAGKSRCCKQRLSPTYFFGEAIAAILSSLLAWMIITYS